MNSLADFKLKLPFVIVVAHQKGGSGKTTTCINLSVELSKLLNTTVIDADSLKQFTTFNSKRKEPLNQKHISTSEALEQHLRADDGLTIIDLGGYDSDFSRAALILSDMIIIPMSDSDNDIDGLGEFMSILEKTQSVRADIKPFVLVNRVHHADKSTHNDLSAFAKDKPFEVFDTVIRNNKLHTKMIFTGENVVEKKPTSKPAKEILSLVEEILTKA